MFKKLFQAVGITPRWGNVPLPTENGATSDKTDPKKLKEAGKTESPRKEKDK
jgi:hypothetical protein